MCLPFVPHGDALWQRPTSTGSGQWIVVELLPEAIGFFGRKLDYRAPTQNLRVAPLVLPAFTA
jgi:hypothetical protein